MGLFSSKKKTYVNTTVQKVFEESQIPDSIATGVMRGIIGEDDIVANMMEEVIGSIAIKADNGYNWAKKNYSPGMPVSDIKSVISAKSIVLNTLASVLHSNITPDYYYFGPLNSVHFGWQTLVDSYAYDPQTNEIKGLKTAEGWPVYLTDIVATYQRKTFDDAVEYSDTGVFSQYGPAPDSGYRPSAPLNTLTGFGQYAAQSDYFVSDKGDSDYITISYEYLDVTKQVIVTRSLNVTMANLDLESDYHHVRYKRADDVIGFFTYKEGEGTYPEIDGAMETDFTNVGTYYPWLYFRAGGVPISAPRPQLADWYADSVKWADKLGIDYDHVSEGVEADPDVDDVEQCIMMFGVNAGATKPVEIDYLFEYFNLLYLNGTATQDLDDSLENQFNDYAMSPTVVQTIRDGVFKMRISHSGIAKKRVAGKLGPRGTVTGKQTSFPVAVRYRDEETGRLINSTTQMAGYTYCKQTSGNVYEQIDVYNPIMAYDITSKKGTTAKTGEDTLIIPLDRAIVKNLTIRDKEELLTRSLYMVVNTKVVVKTKWYSSTWFKVVLIIVAIVITVVTMGGASGIAASLATLAASSATVIAIAVITTIVKALVISYAMKLFVKAVGPEVGLIVAIAAIAYGGYSAYASETATQASWATTTVSLGTNLATRSTEQYQSMIEDIQSEMADYASWAQGQFDTLQEKKDQMALDSAHSYLGLDFVQYEPLIVFGETPNDLYTRTVHSGNIGTVGFDMVSGFVGSALTLPTLQQTEEGINNAGWTI